MEVETHCKHEPIAVRMILLLDHMYSDYISKALNERRVWNRDVRVLLVDVLNIFGCGERTRGLPTRDQQKTFSARAAGNREV